MVFIEVCGYEGVEKRASRPAPKYTAKLALEVCRERPDRLSTAANVILRGE
jgi:hypothetical protein